MLRHLSLVLAALALLACGDRRAAPATPLPKDPRAESAPPSEDPWAANAQPAEDPGTADAPPAVPLWTERAQFKTKLMRTGPAPQPYDNTLPAGFKEVRYPSSGVELRAWIARPKARGRRPAVVFAHGGFALGVGDDEPVRPFVEAGFVALLPTYRGENGNPGNFEMWLGEVDDLIAAVRWLAADRQVDPARIYVFGHSAGGAIAAQLALAPDVPVVVTAGIDALYDDDIFDAMSDLTPFDRRRPDERRMRLLLPNLRSMQRPHLAYLAADGFGYLERAAVARAARAGAPLTVATLPGDHLSVVPAATQAFFQHVQQLEAQRRP